MPSSRGDRAGFTRALVVQQEPVHEEVIASLREVLQANGVTTRFVLDDGIAARGDLFATFTDFADEVRYAPLRTDEGWEIVRDLAADADLMVFNTFQLTGHARRARQIGLPTLGLVHNPRLFSRQPECWELARSGQLALATLSPHATTALIGLDPRLFADAATLGAWMFPLPDAVRLPRTDRRRIAIPGAVDFRNRDYRALVERLGDTRPDYEIAIVGGGQDHAALRELVRERGLDDVFTFCPVDEESGQVRSEVLYPELARSDFLLPMLPPARRDYREWKISAAVSSSIGFSVPAILDRWTATAYGIPCVRYANGDELGGIERALALPDSEVGDLRAGLDGTRDRMRADAIREGGHALARLWQTSHGASPGLAASSTDTDAFLAFAREVLPSSYAQRFQDLWALWASGFCRDGFFVEFGATDGVGYSNTYLLERLGWTGVVAEPNPAHAEALRRNRTCTVSTKVVLDTSGDTVEFHAVKDKPALSTVSGFGADDLHREKREEFEAFAVETITLGDLLEESGAPAVVDFLSIDTEGSELAILASHDFGRFPIRVISVEHNWTHRAEIHDLLRSRGFSRAWPEVSGHDDWYVHSSLRRPWSTDGRDAIAEAIRGIEPFEAGYADRQSALRTLVDREDPIEPLPASPVVDNGALALFLWREAADRARQSGLSPRVQRTRSRGVFQKLAGVVDPSLTVRIGAPQGPAAGSGDVRDLEATEVGASRLAALLGDAAGVVVWARTDDARRLAVDASPLWARAKLASVTIPRDPGDDGWPPTAVVGRLAGFGLLPVAVSTPAGLTTTITFVSADLLDHPRVPQVVTRAFVPRTEAPGTPTAAAPTPRLRRLARRISGD